MSATAARDYLGGFTLLALARGGLDGLPPVPLLPGFHQRVIGAATLAATNNGARWQGAKGGR